VSAGPALRRVWAILKKELIQLKRDKGTFGMIVMIPIMQLLLFGYAINTDPKHMPAAVLAKDSGIIARSFIAGMENSGYFSMERGVSSEREGRLLLQQGRISFLVTIPENFSRDLVREAAPRLLIEADATDPIATAGALSAAGGILDAVVRRDMTGPLARLQGKAPPFQVQVQRLYNPEGLTRYNIIPGLIGVVLTMTGVMMTALALTRERERGTMENLLAMPVRPIEVMAGKIAPYVLIGYIQSFIIVGAAVLLFSVPVLGSLLLLAGVLLVFIVCNLALGFTLSAGAKNQMQAMQMSMFTFLPSLMLSGFMFPFQGMPKWAQVIGNALPMTYFIRTVRGIMLKGSGPAEIWPHVWPMLIFMAVITTIAMKFYRRTLD
jgi:ABC-2 type transport system permease protein